MEILDIYDSNRMPTGRTFVRGTKPEGGYYLVAQVIAVSYTHLTLPTILLV